MARYGLLVLEVQLNQPTNPGCLSFNSGCCCCCLCADDVREYFGETIAMYFAFIGYYTYFLAPPAFLGVLTTFYVSEGNRNFLVTLFCVFNLVWATIFLESWKRKCSELAYMWGTIDMEQFEEPRAEFYGELGKDPVTGQLQPQYPNFHRRLKFYCVSVPVMLFAMVVAWYSMLLYFFLEDYFKPIYTGNSSLLFGTILRLTPSVVYAVLVLILSAIYQRLAVALNVWGNQNLLLSFAYINHHLQCFDTVGWATGWASGLSKSGCWFVGGDDLTGALHVFSSGCHHHFHHPLV